MNIQIEITDRPRYHKQWGAYDLKVDELSTDLSVTLRHALSVIRDGASSITVPVRNYGVETGTLTVTDA